MRAILLVGALALLGGCASTTTVRGLADKTGTFVSSLSAGTSDFLENQNRLNAENAQRLDKMVTDGSADRANVRQQRLAWVDSGDTARIATYDAATARLAEDIIAGMDVKAMAPLTVSATALVGYSATQKALADVAAKPKPGVALRELITFGSDVASTYGDLKDKATKAAEASQTAATTADANAATSAATTPK